MTAGTRLRIAEACAGLVVLAMFLPWTFVAGDSTTGVQVGEGQLMLLAGVATVILIRLGIRAAWITVGFSAAVMWRQVLDPGDGVDVGIGLRVGAVAATIAMVLLVWNMFAEVRASAPGD